MTTDIAILLSSSTASNLPIDIMQALNVKIIGVALIIFSWASNSFGVRHPGCETGLLLLPRNAEYKAHCEGEEGTPGADPRWPCFTMWRGDLTNLEAAVIPDGKPDDFFLVKDGAKIDFTTRDPSKPFTLKWENAELSYSDFDKESGCYKLTVKTSYDIRIWVSDESNKERSGDTQIFWTNICTKWTHIHIGSKDHGW
ncbi:related to Mig1 protein, induced during biotrophic phase [Ustilago trichophora]|uniref:Related to Mig1 protein, induced during biotrophic phase n=1 Tax=Ustilago trichophora TaxID=86804 RepID=A0A5C3E6U4_9BASI|nr:related to Mig1 protein, induced during biotrophic phase [Ustilago trichophora]